MSKGGMMMKGASSEQACGLNQEQTGLGSKICAEMEGWNGESHSV